MKAFQLVLLIGVMAAPHVSWAAESVDTQTLAPGEKASPTDLAPATSLPAVQGGITNKSVKQPDLSEGATPEGITKIDTEPALGRGDDKIIEDYQARGTRDAKDMVPGLVERPDGINPELGLGRDKGPDLSKLPGYNTGSEFDDPNPYAPDLPSNEDKGKLGGAPIGPSNPQDAMKGAASQQWPWESDEPTATLPRARSQGPNGRYDFPGSGGGWRPMVRRPRAPERYYRQVGRTYEVVVDHGNGSYEHIKTTRDENGNMVDQRSWSIDKDGRRTDLGAAEKGIAKLEGTEGGSGDGAWARWWAKISGQRPDLSLKNPNKVNPGPEEGATIPKVPRLQIPENQLVINPDPDAAGAQGGTPDQRTAEMLRRQVENGGGPGGQPPPPSAASDAMEAVVPPGP